MKWKKWTVRTLRWVAVGIAALILSLCAMFGLAQTDLGKRWLLTKLAQTLNAEGEVQVELGELEGLIPFNIELKHVRISDDDGPLLKLENAHLHWSPWPLIRRRIQIEELSADVFRLDRLPRSEQKAEAKRKKEPAWPPRIPSFRLERLHVARLELGAGVIGQEAAFIIDGRIGATDAPIGLRGSFRLERLDGPKDRVLVEWSLKGKGPELSLSAAISEEGDGLVSAAAGLRGLGSVSATLNGTGPLQDWSGRLVAEAENLGAIESQINVQALKALSVTGEGSLRTDYPLFPPELASFSKGGETIFVVDAAIGEREELLVHRLSLDTGVATLEVSGRLGWAERHLNTQFSLQAGDLSALGPVFPTAARGQLDLSGEVVGSFDNPEATLSIKLKRAQVAAVQLDSIETDVEIALLSSTGKGLPALSISGKGDVKGLRVTGGQEWPAQDFQWSLDADMPSSESISLHELKVEGADFSLDASGQMNPTDVRFSGTTLAEIRDLRPFSDLLGTAVSGAVSLRAGLEGDKHSITADISGILTDLSPIPPSVAPLASREIACKAVVRLNEGAELVVTNLAIETAHLQLTGEASADLRAKTGEGQWHVLIPDVSGMSELVGAPLKGALDGHVEVAGSPSDVRLGVRATGKTVSYKGLRFEQLRTILEARGLPARASGHVQIEFEEARGKAKIETDMALSGRKLALSALSLEAPGLELGGDVEADFSGPALEGTLQGNAKDLSMVSAAIGAEMDGHLRFVAKLKAADKGQTLHLDLQAAEFRSPFGDAGAMTLVADLTDVFRDPSGKAKLDVKSFQKDGLQISSAALRAEAQGEVEAFRLRAEGVYGEPFELESNGDLNLSSDGMRVRLHALKGTYARYPFALAKRTALLRSKDGIEIADTDLHIASGRLQASGRLGAEDVAFESRFKDIPLKILGLFGTPRLEGSTSGQIRMTGRADRPEASASIDILGARMPDASLGELPEVNISTDVALQGGILRAETRIEGLSDKPIEGNLKLPAILSISPFAFSLPPGEDLVGSLTGELSLKAIQEYVQLEDQTIQGGVTASLAASGPLKKPSLTGEIVVSDGAYEHLTTGTILRDIQASVKLDQRRLSLDRATATDGEAGRLSSSGWLDLSNGDQRPLEIKLDINEARLVRREDFTAVTGGTLHLSGALTDAALSGELIVGPAELQIPDGLPADIPDLEVIEINRPDDAPAPEVKEEPSRPSRLALDLAMTLPGQVFVRGRGLDSEWKGNLRITGTSSTPSITGTLSVVRGYCNLLGKRFDLTRGDITFAGHVPPAPYLDVTAEKVAKDLTARIKITGTPSSPSITLESDPDLPRDEILARVLFGRSVADITPMQAVLLADGVASLTGGGSGSLDIMGRTRRLTGLDQVDVRQGEEGKQGPAVGVGKYLTDDIYVEVEQGTGVDSGEVSVEVEVTPNISVESETGADAQSGVGVNLKLDY